MSTDDKIKEFVGDTAHGVIMGYEVYFIDDWPTRIFSVHGNFAKGAIIVNSKLEECFPEDCYIAKVGSCYAHGDTLKEAFHFANTKSFHVAPLKQRIEEFVIKYPSLDIVADNKDLFTWHNYLTGSCKMGRRAFATEHNIDVEKGTMTIRDFIRLTRDSYGGEKIKMLETKYQ